jgi:3-oxoacyl-[acyl-carrier-protein] synthase II
MRRVVITGIGLVTALGTGTEATWHRLIEGQTEIGPIRGFDATSLATQLGAEIPNFDPSPYVRAGAGNRDLPKADQFAVAAAAIALQDAQLDMEQINGERAGIVLGGGEPAPDVDRLATLVHSTRRSDGTQNVQALWADALSTLPAEFYIESVTSTAMRYLASAYKLSGTNCFLAGTEDVGAMAIARSYRAIRRGEVDFVLTGGFDDAVSWWGMSRWDKLSTLSPRTELGATACRPYDRNRSGTVLGQGAVILVLEDRESASRRGARVYAEITGIGNHFDTYGMATPQPEGTSVSFAIQAALREARVQPEEIDYIASHGAATQRGDLTDARGIRGAFGAAADRVAASSVKPATGHLLAAAGALNVAVTALTLYHQVAPPTLNLEDPDPACALDWIPAGARHVRATRALALARGFEGQNVALVLSAQG